MKPEEPDDGGLHSGDSGGGTGRPAADDVAGGRSEKGSSTDREKNGARERKGEPTFAGVETEITADGSGDGIVRPLYSEADWARVNPREEDGEPWRNETRRDYARVVHCPAFRRLQGKTQLFPGHESDFFRNRLTHSLEVAQIAESIAYRLNAVEPYFEHNPIDSRLCAVAALVHDLGHPPFGHNGEKALSTVFKTG